MRTVFRIPLTAALAFAPLCATAETEEHHAVLSACIDTGFAELTASRSRDFSSPQYRVICEAAEPPECQTEDKEESFSFVAPAGFRLDDVRFDVISQTARTTVGELHSDGSRAAISLQCAGKACGARGKVYVGGTLAGRLVYEPTAEDAKSIAGGCVEQVLNREGHRTTD